MTTMNFSQKGIDFLIKEEGAYPKVYDDLTGESEKRAGMVSLSDPSSFKGWPTIGIGHVLYHTGSWNRDERSRFSPYLRGGESMTQRQMVDLLREDLPYYENSVRNKITVPITQGMYDALVVHTFNVGGGSRSLKEATAAINKKDWIGAAEAIGGGKIGTSGATGEYQVLEGLVKRRKRETEYFLNHLPKPLWKKVLVPTLIGLSALLLGTVVYTRVYKPNLQIRG
jgi:GH24 family phage-related lysozyme (muramidase)